MTISLEAALTAVAVTFPTPDRGEPPEQRIERLGLVSHSVVQAAERATCHGVWMDIDAPCRRIWPGHRVSLAALLWGLGYLESGYAEWVHDGRCRLELGECDAERDPGTGALVATAVSPWQLKRTLHSVDAWEELVGKGEWSTFQAAWTAARVVSASRRMCEWWMPAARSDWMTATIAAYATGNACQWPRAGKRARFVARVEARLREELAGR